MIFGIPKKGEQAKSSYHTVGNHQTTQQMWMRQFNVGMMYDRKTIYIN